MSAVYTTTDEDQDTLIVATSGRERLLVTAEGEHGQSVSVWVDARELRDALTAHLGDAPAPAFVEFTAPARDFPCCEPAPLADWERELLTGFPYQAPEDARREGYAQGKAETEAAAVLALRLLIQAGGQA